MMNENWLTEFPEAMVNYLPVGECDHSPAILNVEHQQFRGKRPFRYVNMWKLANDARVSS